MLKQQLRNQGILILNKKLLSFQTLLLKTNSKAKLFDSEKVAE